MSVELRAEVPTRFDTLWLIPVVAVSRVELSEDHGGYAYRGKAPHAVIVVGPEGVRTIPISGQDCDLSDLKREVAGLAETLATLGC